MKWLLAWLLSIALLGAKQSWAVEDWQQVKDRNDIHVFNRAIDGSPLKEFKGVTTMDASLAECLKVIDDSESFRYWFQYVSEIRELKTSPDHTKTLYVVHDLPWPVQDRDNILFGSWKQDKKSLEVVISITGLPDYLPKNEQYIRIPRASASFVLTPISKYKTQVTYSANVDSGGEIPVWLANAVAVDAPYYTLKKMRSRLLVVKGTNPHFDFIKEP